MKITDLNLIEAKQLAMIHSRINYDRPDNVQKVSDYINSKGYFMTGPGLKYKSALAAYSHGNKSRECIYCGNMLGDKNHLLCDKCFMQLNDIAEGRMELPVEAAVAPAMDESINNNEPALIELDESMEDRIALEASFKTAQGKKLFNFKKKEKSGFSYLEAREKKEKELKEKEEKDKEKKEKELREKEEKKQLEKEKAEKKQQEKLQREQEEKERLEKEQKEKEAKKQEEKERLEKEQKEREAKKQEEKERLEKEQKEKEAKKQEEKERVEREQKEKENRKLEEKKQKAEEKRLAKMSKAASGNQNNNQKIMLIVALVLLLIVALVKMGRRGETEPIANAANPVSEENMNEDTSDYKRDDSEEAVLDETIEEGTYSDSDNAASDKAESDSDNADKSLADKADAAAFDAFDYLGGSINDLQSATGEWDQPGEDGRRYFPSAGLTVDYDKASGMVTLVARLEPKKDATSPVEDNSSIIYEIPVSIFDISIGDDYESVKEEFTDKGISVMDYSDSSFMCMFQIQGKSNTFEIDVTADENGKISNLTARIVN